MMILISPFCRYILSFPHSKLTQSVFVRNLQENHARRQTQVGFTYPLWPSSELWEFDVLGSTDLFNYRKLAAVPCAAFLEPIHIACTHRSLNKQRSQFESCRSSDLEFNLILSVERRSWRPRAVLSLCFEFMALLHQ